MRFRSVLSLLLSVSLVGACASPPSQPTRFALQGFSISLPIGERWQIVEQKPDRLVLGKPGEFAGQVFTVQAIVVKLPALRSEKELLRHVESAQRQMLDPKRFRILSHDVGPHELKGESCALSHLAAEDRAPVSATGPAANLFLETLTLTCAHPKDRKLGIDLTYLHKYYPEDRDPKFVEKGKLILEWLTFTDP